MSTETTNTDADVEKEDESTTTKRNRWSISSEDGPNIARTGYSDYELRTDTITITFDGVRKNDDGTFELKSGHKTQAVVDITNDTVSAVLDVLSTEI